MPIITFIGVTMVAACFPSPGDQWMLRVASAVGQLCSVVTARLAPGVLWLVTVVWCGDADSSVVLFDKLGPVAVVNSGYSKVAPSRMSVLHQGILSLGSTCTGKQERGRGCHNITYLSPRLSRLDICGLLSAGLAPATKRTTSRACAIISCSVPSSTS